MTVPKPGHNSVPRDQLKAFVERIEKLAEEKKAITEDIREVVAEAKAVGFNPKALRELVKLRAQDPDARKEHEHVLDLYRSAMGLT